MIDEKFEKWKEAGYKYWFNKNANILTKHFFSKFDYSKILSTMDIVNVQPMTVPFIKNPDGLKLCEAVCAQPMNVESEFLKFKIVYENEEGEK